MSKRVSARRLADMARRAKTRNTRSQRRVVFYDLETSIVSKAREYEPFCTGIRGMKRRNLIVEIGAVDWDVDDAPARSSTFHQLVDPRLEHSTLAETFEITNQNPKRTLSYWIKLFGEKKMVEKSLRKATIEDQIRAFDTLFDGGDFTHTKRALSLFIAFCLGQQRAPETPLLVAHAGKSFDHQIVRAFCHRLHLPQFGNYMVDSLHVARRILPRLKSHSLGSLHNKLIGTDFEFAHHAMADAHALLRVCRALAQSEELAHVSDLWSDTVASLTQLRGIGPRTAKLLRQEGYDMPTLRACVMSNEACPDELKRAIRNHKSLWKSLRKKWAKPPVLAQAEKNHSSAAGKKAPPKRDEKLKFEHQVSFIRRTKLRARLRSKSV